MCVIKFINARRPLLVLLVSVLISIALTGCGGGGGGAQSSEDICSSSDTGLVDASELAISCYAGTFLQKMLGELKRGPALSSAKKSQQHVRFHLLPYLGGLQQLNAMKVATGSNDGCRDSNCTTCIGKFSGQEDTADALSKLRDTVPLAQMKQYDGLNVCFMALTDAIMDKLPKDSTGTWLVPESSEVSTFEQTKSLFQGLFTQNGGLESLIGCVEPDFPPGVAKMWEWVNVCDGKDKSFTDSTEEAVFCYIASFVQKMLLELTVCPPLGFCRKTENHVRLHLTPYMGGNVTTAAIKTDNPNDPNCTACYQDDICAEHQQAWIDKPCCFNTDLPIGGKPPGQCPESISGFRRARDIYFNLKSCYAPYTNYIMEALPKHGMWLLPPTAPDTPHSLTVKIVKSIFEQTNVRACAQATRQIIDV